MDGHEWGKNELDAPEMVAAITVLGEMAAEITPRNYGFMVIMAEWGSGPGFFYCSNIQRQDVIKMLQETIAKLEKEGK